MKYTADEVMQFVQEEDVKFIRLAFCDIYGKQKNISIMPGELPRAFEQGIAVDASAISGFGGEIYSDLFLHPDAGTLSILPWRPEHGKVVRMFCSVAHPDGTIIENDTRNILKKAIADAAAAGLSFDFGSELEFYLFQLDESGGRTNIPYDNAGYMDIAPDDRGENVRREICLTLERMGICPESSHHEEGPGQNEIDFRYSDALSAADNTVTLCSVVKAVALRNGLYADFSPKPLKDKPGNGFHINMSVKAEGSDDLMPYMIAGVLGRIAEITAFLNPGAKSYERLGSHKAPKYVSWSRENRSQLIRIPAASGSYRRMELRSPDSMTNPYLAFALLIYAAMEGIEKRLDLQAEDCSNLFAADGEALKKLKTLPANLKVAQIISKNSEFVKKHLPNSLIALYCGEEKT